MNGLGKYAVFGVLGVAALIGGSLLVAAGIDTDEDTFAQAFLVTLGIAVLLFGVATAVGSITTYLASHH